MLNKVFSSYEPGVSFSEKYTFRNSKKSTYPHTTNRELIDLTDLLRSVKTLNTIPYTTIRNKRELIGFVLIQSY